MGNFYPVRAAVVLHGGGASPAVSVYLARGRVRPARFRCQGHAYPESGERQCLSIAARQRQCPSGTSAGPSVVLSCHASGRIKGARESKEEPGGRRESLKTTPEPLAPP